MDADALSQIREARTGRFLDWWSPILDWFWRLLFLLHISPGFVVLGSTSIFVLSLYAILHCFLSRWTSTAWSVAMCLFPPVFGFLGSLQRDTWFGALTFAAYASTLRAYNDPDPTSRRVLRTARGLQSRLIALSLIAAWLAIATRQNGVIAIAPAVVIDAHLVLRRCLPRWSAYSHGWLRRLAQLPAKFLAIAVGLVLLAIFGGSQNVLTYHVIDATQTYPEQELFEGDLAQLSLRTHQILLPPFIFPSQDPAVLAHFASPYTVLPLIAGPAHPLDRSADAAPYPSFVNGADDARLRSDWVHAITSHPTSYLDYRWHFWLHLIAWNAPAYEPYHPGFDRNEWGYKATFPTLDRTVQRYLGHFSSRNLTGGALYRIWVYLLIGIAISVDLLRRSRGALARVIGCYSAAIIVYYGGYFFLAMGNGFRWAWLMVTSVVVAVVIDAADHLSTRRRSVTS
jgi:hypothetical protein